MKSGGKTCAKCGCDMDSKKEKYEEDDDMKSGGRACMKCGGKMHKSGGTISSCMKCGGGKYTFGGKTGWMSKKKNDVRKYQAGGLASTSADKEIALSSGAFNVAEPTYDASVISNEKPMQITDNAMQGTNQLNYKEAVQSFRKKEVDKTLPNFGYAKQEQIKLNELIRKDISTGNAKMDLLSEDDIIGEKTLGAMRAYEASGQYTRPEGFKDKWLAEYKKQWDEMQATGKSPKGPAPKATVEQPKKEEKREKTLVDSIYDYFKPPKKQQAVKETPKKSPRLVNELGYEYYIDKKTGFTVVTIPDEDIQPDESEKYTDDFVKKEKKSKKGSFFPSASDMMGGLQSSVDYAGNALSSFIGNTADFIKNNQNKTTDNKKYSVKSRAASVSAEKISQKKSGVTVLRKYDSSGPSYTKSKIVVKDNITNKTHTVTIPQMFDKAKGKYHTIEIAGKKHKIFLDPNLK